MEPMDYKVISADDHLDLRFFPADLWTRRAPAKLKDRVPHIEDVDGLPFWVCDGKRWGRWGQFKADGPRQWALERGGVMNEGELRPTTPELRLQDMDRDGVDATVMYGPTDPFYTDDPERPLRAVSRLQRLARDLHRCLPRAPDRRLTDPARRSRRPPPKRWSAWPSSAAATSTSWPRAPSHRSGTSPGIRSGPSPRKAASRSARTSPC